MIISGNTILPIILLLLIIIAIVFGYYIYNKLQLKEAFSQSSCNYMAWGPTVDSCSNNCISSDRVGLWDIDGKQCNKGICDKICASCTDLDNCQWVNSWSPEELRKLKKTEDEPTLPVPSKLQISGISYPDTGAEKDFDGKANIKIFWQINGDADSFMIHYFNMSATEDFIKITTISHDKNEHELKNIISNSEYSVIMYAINKYGVSPASNVISVKT